MDSFEKITEQPSVYDHLESMTTRSLMESINDEDSTVALAVRKCLPVAERLVDALVTRVNGGGHIYYIGAGTSGRLGVLDAAELPTTFGVKSDIVRAVIAGGDRALREAVEGAEDDREQGWKDVMNIRGVSAYGERASDETLIGISASGATPYVVGALEKARENGWLTASVTCNPGSPAALISDYPIVAVVGPEFVTGSSRMKGGTAQKMILGMISTTLMIRLGHVEGNIMVDMRIASEKLIDRGARVVARRLGLGYEEARKRLLRTGSVRKAYGAEKDIPL